MRQPVALPRFPWDSLLPAKRVAETHPQGLIDLSVGTPVDPTPESVRVALAATSNAPGYPPTYGTPELRATIADWLLRHRSVTIDPEAILPVIGTKEAVAWLPTLLGVAGVAYPALAYPTYEIGALLAQATPIRYRSTVEFGPSAPDLVWTNSPANPHGGVLPIEHLKKMAQWAQERSVLVAADECYAGLDWTRSAPSLLADEVTGGNHTQLLILHSLSKYANMAGYRFGFIAGDATIIASLLEVSKHAGMMVPAPVQAAAIAAYQDDEHLAGQKERYRRRRDVLLEAFRAAGFRIDESHAGLYLWATRHESCWESVDWLADRGILVAPGEFYGPEGQNHVRIALTATDEAVAKVGDRLAGN